MYGGTEKQQRSDATVWRMGDIAEMMGMVGA